MKTKLAYVNSTTLKINYTHLLSSRYLLVQSKQCKHQNNKVNNKLLLFLYLKLTTKKKVEIQLKSLNLQYIKLPKR